MSRNRAEGWKHAKLSGHNNESLIKNKLNSNQEELSNLGKRLGSSSLTGIAEVGGLHETSVKSVLGNLTKSKTDLIIKWNDESSSKISIKKSEAGQVFLIRTSRFINGYEKQFKEIIPNNVKEALYLFFGEGKDIQTILSKIEIYDAKIRKYEVRKNRLVWKTLLLYNKDYAESLLQWLINNVNKISKYCFSMGLAKNKNDWAEYIWYKNLLGEDSMDFLFSINKLSSLSQSNAKKYIVPGKVGGGTTIQLPFGFLQWHQGQMQFHHKLSRIEKIFN